MDTNNETPAARDDFFDSCVDRYRKVIENQEFIKQSSLNSLLNSLLTGDVLDIGNGGVLDYDPGKSSSFFSLDKSLKMLERADTVLRGRITCGDLKDLPIKCASFDAILCKFLFHHLVTDTLDSTERYQRECLGQILRALRPDGKLIIVDNCVPPIIESAQLLGFSLWQKMFTWLSLPRLRFFSCSQLILLLRSGGFKDFVIHKIVLKRGWELVPFILAFPMIKIPAKFYPFEVILIEARRGSGAVAPG